MRSKGQPVKPTTLLSFYAQLKSLLPAVAAYEAKRAETVTARRARGTGREPDSVRGRKLRERIVEIVSRQGCARVSDIADALGVSPGCASHHLSVLVSERRLRRRGTSQQGYELGTANHA